MQRVHALAMLCLLTAFAYSPAQSEAGWFSFGNKDEAACECPECQQSRQEEKKKSRCCCFDCADPPRGQFAISVAGRLNPNAISQAQSKADIKAQAATKDRLDKLEEDVTKLTLLVEKLAENQKTQQTEFTRALLVLEKIAAAKGVQSENAEEKPQEGGVDNSPPAPPQGGVPN